MRASATTPSRARRIAAAMLFGLWSETQVALADGPASPSVLPATMSLAAGAKVLFVPDPSSPVVAIATTFPVGERHDGADAGRGRRAADAIQRGLRGPREVVARGGTTTTWVEDEQTTFVDTLAAGELALGVWCAAERLHGAEALSRGLGSTPPDEVSDERRLEALVLSSTPSHESPAASRFSADSAAVVITGPFDADEVSAVVLALFGNLAPGRTEPPTAPTERPEQTSRRSSFIERAGARRVLFGFAVPGIEDPSHRALAAAAHVLEARLRIQAKDGVTGLTASLHERRGVDLLVLDATLTPRGDAERMRAWVERELANLARGGPSMVELANAKAALRARAIDAVATPAAVARTVATKALFGLDASTEGLDFTAGDVARAVSEHLVPSRMTVLERRPPPPPPTPKPPRPAEATTPKGTTTPKPTSKPKPAESTPAKPPAKPKPRERGGR